MSSPGNHTKVAHVLPITRPQRLTLLKGKRRRDPKLSIVDESHPVYNSRYFYHQLKIEIDRVNRLRTTINPSPV